MSFEQKNHTKRMEGTACFNSTFLIVPFFVHVLSFFAKRKEQEKCDIIRCGGSVECDSDTDLIRIFFLINFISDLYSCSLLCEGIILGFRYFKHWFAKVVSIYRIYLQYLQKVMVTKV